MRPIQAKMSYPTSKRIDTIEKAFVEVILGRPSAECKHLGVCKIERVYSNSFGVANSVLCQSSDRLYALASLKEDVYFELAFERNSISDAIYKLHFKSGIFKVEEDYTTDLALGESAILITKGEYKVRVSDTLLAIRFEMK